MRVTGLPNLLHTRIEINTCIKWNFIKLKSITNNCTRKGSHHI